MREQRRRAVDGRAVARFLIRSTRRVALTVVGFVLVCLGLAGLVLPVLPGWVLIIGGFAVLSREYSWANNCLAFCRRHAARSGSKLRSLAGRSRARRRWARAGVGLAAGRDVVLDPSPSNEVVIDLTHVPEEAAPPAAESTTSQAL